MEDMYFLFDIGGTNMRLGISRDGDSLDAFVIVPTPAPFEEGIAVMRSFVEKQAATHGRIRAAAGGIAAPMLHGGVVGNAPNLADWRGKPLTLELEKELGLPVTIENDAVLAGIGEAAAGAGEGFGIVAYVTIGTGLGGARIVNGKPDARASGFEPGHQIVMPGGTECGCGGKGHLEAYVSGSGMEKIHGKGSKYINESKQWERTEEWLAIGLNNIIVHWSPDILIIGGGPVVERFSVERINTRVNELLTIMPMPKIKRGALGDKAVLHGARALLVVNP